MKKALVLFLFIVSALAAKATHNRAGEITYKQVSGFTYQFTIVTFTDNSSNADRNELMLYFGDGDSIQVTRYNGPDNNSDGTPDGEIVGNNIKQNLYSGTHTYRGAGTFTASITDPNRNADVINIPNSVNVSFYIETKLVISPFLGINNSPTMLNPPIDNACFGKKFVHNPGAWDIDGDSISYRLITCKQEGGVNISGYTIPGGVSLNPLTGDFVWNSPQPAGEFNFAILIEEWRNGVLIGSIIRDMQVTVVGNCNNNPPVIDPLPNYCVDAGEVLTFSVRATDIDQDPVTLTSTGGPYLLSSSPATFQAFFNGLNDTINGEFKWNTNCSHIRVQPYQVSFKAEDDGSGSTPVVPLVDLKTISIRVICPGPTSLTVNSQGKTMILNWIPTTCTNAKGYKIYRREGPSGFVPTDCETGIPASTGYVLIKTLDGATSSNFIDDNNGLGLDIGVEYCYMIYAYFEEGSESYASNEDCESLKKDVPLITNVSVITTSPSGSMYVAWSMPTQIDSTLFAGPYHYRILRADRSNASAFTVLDSLGFSAFIDGTPNESLYDTIYVDNGVDTQTKDYLYKIEVVNTNPYKVIGPSKAASSIFLGATPNDNQIELSWNEDVPWKNSSYTIYRAMPSSLSVFDSLTTVSSQSYVDAGLVNGATYCYYIKSKGAYSIDGVINPIYNLSQIICAQPKDLTPPCAPKLSINSSCPDILNTLTWNNPNYSCADDVVAYKIYYTPVYGDSLLPIATINLANDTVFTHNNEGISIAGCYFVAAVDSFANESPIVDTICVDNCPVYRLPNVFTPNGDANNDLFIPVENKFVKSIDLQIFNRWGNLVFKSTDPKILWKGDNQQNSKQLADGVYYYVCIVNEIRLAGIIPRDLHGFVHILSQSQNAKSP